MENNTNYSNIVISEKENSHKVNSLMMTSSFSYNMISQWSQEIDNENHTKPKNEELKPPAYIPYRSSKFQLAENVLSCFNEL